MLIKGTGVCLREGGRWVPVYLGRMKHVEGADYTPEGQIKITRMFDLGLNFF